MLELEQVEWIVGPVPRSRLPEVFPYFGMCWQEFGIDLNPIRVAMWIAQVGHESDSFQALREYASGRRYEGRLDLGNTEPGDGERFAGRGLIQLTGRSNYIQYGQELYGDPRLFLDDPWRLEQPPEAVRSAGWFWASRGLNELADQGDFYRVTRRINGGTNGWNHRLDLFQRAQACLGVQ